VLKTETDPMASPEIILSSGKRLGQGKNERRRLAMKHQYAGMLENSINLDIEILFCGACGCWFGIDSGALESDAPLACPYCYEFVDIDFEGACETAPIESLDDFLKQKDEIDAEIYKD